MEQMSPEIVASIVAVLGAIAAYIKSKIDLDKVKADRTETAALRDQEAVDLRERVRSLELRADFTKEKIDNLVNQISDNNEKLNLLNTQMARLLERLDSMTEERTTYTRRVERRSGGNN